MSSRSFIASKTRRPLQVFSIFAAGIIIPAGFLVFLGLRSFKYESIVLQKKSEEQYSAVADLVQKKANTVFGEMVAALEGVARQDEMKSMYVPAMIPVVLSISKLQDNLIDHLYVFDDQDRLLIPKMPENERHESEVPNDLEWGPLRQEITRLEDIEFVKKDVSAALNGYQALQGRSLSTALQAALLKNIAGAFRKLHDDRSAETAYLKLARNFDQVVDVSGVPMGLLAGRILSKLYEDRQAWDNKVDVDLNLYEGVLLDKWSLDRVQASRLLDDFEKSLAHDLSSHGKLFPDRNGRFERLKRMRISLREQSMVAEVFAKSQWPDVLKRLRTHGWLDQGGILQLSGAQYEGKLAVVAPIAARGSDRRRGLIVAIISREPLMHKLEEVLSEQTLTLGLEGEWDFSRSNSNAKATSGLWKATVERRIDSIDPSIRFRIAATNSTDLDQMTRRRLWIYGGIIGLSLVVIVVGLWLMRMAVQREVELADLKSDFVANVSHELRTPLTTIAHIGERLRRGRYRSEEERKDFYEMLGQETTHLTELVEDTLDFSKMLAGKKVYRQDVLEVGGLIRGAYERFAGKADARGFTVHIEIPDQDVEILGDAKAIIQVLLNLMDNAMKYSGSSRRIDVQLRRVVEGAEISVRDYGIGISDGEKQKIFEKFYRVDRGMSSESEGGVGLGLAMVKHVMDGHKGLIRVESSVGNGSTFILTFLLA